MIAEPVPTTKRGAPWVERRAVPEARSAGGTVRRLAQHGPLDRQGDEVERLLEAGRERFAGKEERQGERELRRKVAELERALGRKTYELEIAGKLLREWN